MTKDNELSRRNYTRQKNTSKKEKKKKDVCTMVDHLVPLYTHVWRANFRLWALERTRIYTSAKSLTRATELPVAHCARVTSLPQFANRRCRNPPATLVYREISELRGRVHTYVLYKIRRRGFPATNEIYAVSGTRNLRGWKVVGWWSRCNDNRVFITISYGGDEMTGEGNLFAIFNTSYVIYVSYIL